MECQIESRLLPAYRPALILKVSEALNNLSQTSFVPFCEIMEYFRCNYIIDGDLRSQLHTSLKHAYRMGIIAKKDNCYRLMAPVAILISKPVGEAWRKCQTERLQTVFKGSTINISRCCRLPKRCPLNFKVVSKTPSLGTIYRKREEKNKKCMLLRKLINRQCRNAFGKAKCNNTKIISCKYMRPQLCRRKTRFKCNSIKKKAKYCEPIPHEDCDDCNCFPLNNQVSKCKPVKKKIRKYYDCDFPPYEKNRNNICKPRKRKMKECCEYDYNENCDCPPSASTKVSKCKYLSKKSKKSCDSKWDDDCECPPSETCTEPEKKKSKMNFKNFCYNSPAMRLKRKICEEAYNCLENDCSRSCYRK